MLQTLRSLIARLLPPLFFLLAVLLALQGLAPLIDNALYATHKIFVSWLLIQAAASDNQWYDPIFSWLLAAGFFTLGIVLHTRNARVRRTGVDQAETTAKRRMLSPTWRLSLWVCSIIAYVLLTSYACTLSIGSSLSNASGSIYEPNLTYQGHVYLLSVAPIASQAGQSFQFEVSQCDASGWFCSVIDDVPHQVNVQMNVNNYPPSPYSQLVDAYLKPDASHQQLLIVYHGEGTSDSGTIPCPTP